MSYYEVIPYVIHLEKDVERLKLFEHTWKRTIKKWVLWKAVEAKENKKERKKINKTTEKHVSVEEKERIHVVDGEVKEEEVKEEEVKEEETKRKENRRERRLREKAEEKANMEKDSINQRALRVKACRESHTKLLEHFMTPEFKNQTWVWIMEDDAVPVKNQPLPTLPPPKDAKMLYHGACVYQLVDDVEQQDYTLPNWYRFKGWYAHSYFVRRDFIPELLDMINNAPDNASIDSIYCRSVHPVVPAYVWTPTAVEQRSGHSTIENTTINRREKILLLGKVIEDRRGYPSQIPIIFNMNTVRGSYGYYKATMDEIEQHALQREVPWYVVIHTFDTNLGNLVDWKQLFANIVRDCENGNRGNKVYKNDYLTVSVHDTIQNGNEQTTYPIPEKGKYYDDNYLPTVSLITPLFKGRIWLWLSLYCFMMQDYPRDKMEWIIYDENEDDNSETLKMIPHDDRIHYTCVGRQERIQYYCAMVEHLYGRMKENGMAKKKKTNIDVKTPYRKARRMRPVQVNRNAPPEGLELVHRAMGYHGEKGADFFNKRFPIGLKRNVAVQQAKNEIIIHWDDDDYYPPSSVRERVMALLENPEKKIVGCTTIPCYDVKTHVSWMNVHPHNESLGKIISEASMAYYKSVWEKQKFNGQDIGSEANKFMENREHEWQEIHASSASNIIISLLHRSNLSIRTAPKIEENGWHYGAIDEGIANVIDRLDDPTFPHEDWLVNYIKRKVKELYNRS